MSRCIKFKCSVRAWYGCFCDGLLPYWQSKNLRKKMSVCGMIYLCFIFLSVRYLNAPVSMSNYVLIVSTYTNINLCAICDDVYQYYCRYPGKCLSCAPSDSCLKSSTPCLFVILSPSFVPFTYDRLHLLFLCSALVLPLVRPIFFCLSNFIYLPLLSFYFTSSNFVYLSSRIIKISCYPGVCACVVREYGW